MYVVTQTTQKSCNINIKIQARQTEQKFDITESAINTFETLILGTSPKKKKRKCNYQYIYQFSVFTIFKLHK